MNLILDYESSALAAPQSFLNAMQTAVNILDSTILNNITVTIEVGYNDFLNNEITNLGASAEGGDLSGSFVSYTSLRAALASHETSSLDQTFVNSLPTTSSVNGVSSLYVPSAVEKALGMISPTAPGIDGAVGIGSGIPTADLVGVALHELTHAMGREPGSGTFDLGRYTSPGTHLFSSGSTAPASYFSIDGGVTKLADYGQNSDPSDMLNSGIQGPNDPFNEFYSGSTIQGLTTVDKQQLDAMGFNVTPSATGTPSATTSSLVTSSPTVTANGTSTTTLTVTVKDASGNAVAGTAVTLSGSGAANSFGTISGTTDANGVFKTTLASTLAQNETITATEGGVQEQTAVSFVAGAPSATTSSLVANAPTVAADGTTTTTLTVTVEDANGNAVAGTAVTLSGSGSNNSFGAISGTTNANGVFTTTLASTLVQNETITATEGSVQEHTAVSFVASGPSAATSSLVASSPTVTADGISTTTLTVTVEDAQGHAVAGTVVTLSGSGSANSFGAISGTTNANGVFTTTLASTLVQNETITATEGSAQEHTSVSFVPPAVTGTVIQTDGSTSLTQMGIDYFLYNAGSGPELKSGGAPVTAGEFGGWTPIGAVQTASGYDVAWKDGASSQYSVWSTDSNGNYISNNVANINGAVSGTSTALETIETIFHQDLNGDGVIGVPSVSGTATSLTQIGTNYFLYNAGSGPELKYGGAVVTAGEFGSWTPIGAVETASGYDVAWKVAGADQYSVWSTDSNGNYLSNNVANINGAVSGTSPALETIETIFHQDLNGDGVIGIPSVAGTATSLAQVGTNYFLDNAGSGPELKYGGAPVTAGEFGGWTPIGAVQTATGYDVAWKVAGADQYSVWSTDSSGNYISNNVANINGAVSGTNTALESIETTFHQDLNGDGVIGVPPVATSPVATNQAAAAPAAGSGTVNTAAPGSGGSFVFDPNFGHVTITNVTVPAGINFSHAVFANINALLAAAQDDGHGNVIITDANHDTLTIQKMTAQQLHTQQSDFHII
jgi:protocatechuate 3,4-dioxygenase beta subunit